MIQLHDVTKRHGPTVAVDRLTFEVRDGDVTGFLGLNGAGKSTTMRIPDMQDDAASAAERLARPVPPAASDAVEGRRNNRRKTA